MENFSLNLYNMKKTRRIFSESFKRDKVRIYETGKMSISKLSKLYDVSETALYRWVDKYRTLPSAERIVVETESDYLQLVEVQERVENMERIIGVQQIELDYQRAVIKTASEHYKEDIEKKFGQV